MQTTSATWKQLWASGNAHVKTRVTIADVGTYTEANIVSAKISGVLYPDDDLGIGGVTSRKLELKMVFNDNDPEPARRAKVTVEIALTDGSTTSEWIPKGTYYIDTRETDQISRITTFICYDAMVLTDEACPTISYGSYTMETLAKLVSATFLETNVLDSRTQFESTHYAPKLEGYTYREILSMIGIACHGNWVITDENKLRLIPVGNPYKLVETDGVADYVKTSLSQLTKYDKGLAYPAIDKVTIHVEEGLDYSSGTEGDYNLEYDCPFVGQSETRAVWRSLNDAVTGQSYTPCTMRGRIDPAIEAGDFLGFEDSIPYASAVMTVHPVATQTIYLGSLCLIEVENPTGKDVSHEYAKNVSGGGTNNLMSANRQIQLLNQQIEALTLRMSTAETQIQTISGGDNTSTE